jgi:hypothetical protein
MTDWRRTNTCRTSDVSMEKEEQFCLLLQSSVIIITIKNTNFGFFPVPYSITKYTYFFNI